MSRLHFLRALAGVALLSAMPGLAAAGLVAADDFQYHETTKTLGPGGGFQRQDYGGGQNGAAGGWNGRWVSIGDAIILGPDLADRAADFPNLNADTDIDWALTQQVGITIQILQRDYALSGLAGNQTLYFGVTTRTPTEVETPSALLQINEPGLANESQIGFGLGEDGFRAQMGVATSTGTATAGDMSPHRLIGKLEINAVNQDERLSVWMDPTGVESGGAKIQVQGNVISTLTDLTGGLQLVGAGQAMLWDDVAIGTTWQDVAAVNVPRASLQVDPATGNVSLRNNSSEDFTINYYEILSAGGSLTSGTWQSLDGAVANDGKWEKNLGVVDPTKRLAESSFVGGTLLAKQSSFSLGKAFKVNGTHDLIARIGTTDGLLNLMPVTYGAVTLPGDFNADGSLTAADIDALSQIVRAHTNVAAYDLNSDNVVDDADREVWVKDLKRAWYGDANLDGVFDSNDFVDVFILGEYEDTTANNSDWSDGDWDGDGEFTSADFVVAFIDGGYDQGPRAAVAAVPEPTSLGIVWLAAWAASCVVRRRR